MQISKIVDIGELNTGQQVETKTSLFLNNKLIFRVHSIENSFTFDHENSPPCIF